MTLIKKISVSFVACLITLFTATALPAQAAELELQSVIDTKTTEAATEELLSYAIINEAGDIVGFDIESARLNNASSLVMRSIEEFNSQFSEVTALFQDKSYRAGLPVYGNWCGPGHSGPGAPIDLLDSRCKAHDLCYAKNGYFNKNCDRVLVAQLTIDMNAGRYSGWTWVVANGIRSFFLPNTI